MKRIKIGLSSMTQGHQIFMRNSGLAPLIASFNQSAQHLRHVVSASLITVMLVSLTGCATEALDLAPATPDKPWQDPQLQQQATRAPSVANDGRYEVAPIPAVTFMADLPAIDHKKAYGLSDLINLAQSNNFSTRTAWNHAREAALAVGLVEATFLPIISANVLAGHQRATFPSNLPIGPRDYTTTLSGVMPSLTMGWLVFDFGQRIALLDAAKEFSRAANIIFNAEHQKVIWQVTTRYYDYSLAQSRLALAKDALKNRQQIAEAASARQQAGLGTVVETSLATQGVKQAQLHLVNMQGVDRNAYLKLLAAVGLSPTTKMKVALETADPAVQKLRMNLDVSEQALTQTIAQRPDIAAGYATLQAAKANIQVVQADFFPKVFLAGALAHNNSSFDVQGLPTLNQQMSATGLLLGVTLPLYDGGIRNARLVGAQIRSEQAAQNLTQMQRDALREIVLAQSVLESALQSEVTAKSLLKTAKITYDAAFSGFREGLVSITLVTEAANGLLLAREALLESQVACIVSAANLALAMGQMTSSEQALSLTNNSGASVPTAPPPISMPIKAP